MAYSIQHSCLKYHYHIIYLHDIDAQQLLDTNSPEAIVLSILCRHSSTNATDTIGDIIHRLTRLVPNRRSLRKYLQQLEMLANLRNLQPEITQQIKAMPILYDVTTDLRYQQGYEKATQKAEAKIQALLHKAKQEQEKAIKRENAKAERELAKVERELAKVEREKAKAEREKVNEVRRNTIKNMLQLSNLSVQQIAQICNTTTREVQQIAQKLRP